MDLVNSGRFGFEHRFHHVRSFLCLKSNKLLDAPLCEV